MQQWDTQRKAVLLDHIRDLIAELAERESEVPAVLKILAQTQTWENHFARARQKQAEFDAYWDDFWSVPETCSRCGVEGMRREINSVPGIPNYGKYCPTCAEIVRAAYQRNCVYCWKPYIASAMNKYAELCQDCWHQEWLGEAKRVAVQLRRAQEAGVAATLTLKAWFVTLDFFGWRCAFCSGPFEAMDHFVPIQHGGGTVWSNCLPICKRDNTRKGESNPNTGALNLRFPRPVIERITGYLASCSDEAEAIAPAGAVGGLEKKQERGEALSQDERGSL